VGERRAGGSGRARGPTDRSRRSICRARSWCHADDSFELTVTTFAEADPSARSARINLPKITKGTVDRWKFLEDGKDVEIAVDGRVVTNDGALLVDAAVDGLGLAYEFESMVRHHVAENQPSRRRRDETVEHDDVLERLPRDGKRLRRQNHAGDETDLATKFGHHAVDGRLYRKSMPAAESSTKTSAITSSGDISAPSPASSSLMPSSSNARSAASLTSSSSVWSSLIGSKFKARSQIRQRPAIAGLSMVARQDLNLRPSGYEAKDGSLGLASQGMEIVCKFMTRRGIRRHRSTTGRHATSRDFRSARQRQVNEKITGKNPEGFARRAKAIGGLRSEPTGLAFMPWQSAEYSRNACRR
jgi:hypothetical protein